MNRFARLFSWSIWSGLLVIVFVALPGIFYPASVADLFHVRPPAEPIWPAFAFLLLFIVSWFHVAAALSPLDRLPTAFIVVIGHLLLALFCFWIYPSYQTGSLRWAGTVELTIGVIQFVLLVLTIRDATRLADVPKG
jgi:hypothetical protein